MAGYGLEEGEREVQECPVTPDLVPGHEIAQGWSFVVAGYFLVEQSFKAILYIRHKQVNRIHELFKLFNFLDQCDRDVLREYYTYFQATIDGFIAKLPFKNLDDFLENLDGDRDYYPHWIDWRYFLIEENRRTTKYLIKSHSKSVPLQFTYSWRIRRKLSAYELVAHGAPR